MNELDKINNILLTLHIYIYHYVFLMRKKGKKEAKNALIKIFEKQCGATSIIYNLEHWKSSKMFLSLY